MKKNKTNTSRQTVIRATDVLPLTCTRKGICCHGKEVWLNPWELRALANAAGLSPRAFRDAHTGGGIRLQMSGPNGWRNLPACALYDPACGCKAHPGRPLACRLYPLGRRRSGEKVEYIYEGAAFPCLDGCPEVQELPQLTLEEYLAAQDTATMLAAQEGYLEVMQDLAEGALVLLLDSGLAASGDRQTLPLWRKLGEQSPQERAAGLPPEWLDRLTLAELVASAAADATTEDAQRFVKAHHDQLQQAAQEAFGQRDTAEGLREACGIMMAMALQLGAGLGIRPPELAQRWSKTARAHGAREG